MIRQNSYSIRGVDRADFARIQGVLNRVAILVLPADNEGWEKYVLPGAQARILLNGSAVVEQESGKGDVYMNVRRTSLFMPKIVKRILKTHENKLVYLAQDKESVNSWADRHLLS